jgi:hypothetical protein
MSPDPSGLTYASESDPQSLNHYAYVLNNPLILIDPNGLIHCDPDTHTSYRDPATEEMKDITIPGACFLDYNDFARPNFKMQPNTQGKKPNQGTKNASKCPSKAAATVNRALVNLVLGPPAALLEVPKISGGVIGEGIGGSKAFEGIANRAGFYGSFSLMVYADSQGNLLLGVSPGGGRATGAGFVAGGQITYAPSASTASDMSGPSGAISLGGGGELAGSLEASTNGGGALTGTFGIGAGGWGATAGGGPTYMITLACGNSK